MFKLVRTDTELTEEPNEIQLPSGTYLIGRDKLIGFADKRLSYNHGLIIVKEDSVTIESSQRKIFLTKKGSNEKELLNKTFKTTLDFGDQFGFLENSFWYELQSNEPSHKALKEINVNTSEKSPNFTKQSVVPKSPIDDEKSRKRKKELESSINGKSKKRKEESEEEVSDDQSSQSDGLSESDEDGTSKPAVLRKICKYGVNCYSLRTLRPNPAHKAHRVKYFHPMKECPHGKACRLADPKHVKTFSHPPGFRIYLNPEYSSSSDSEAREEYHSKRMSRAKRERKPLPKEVVEGSESEEEDPFASDGSEDWVPDHYKPDFGLDNKPSRF